MPIHIDSNSQAMVVLGVICIVAAVVLLVMHRRNRSHPGRFNIWHRRPPKSARHLVPAHRARPDSDTAVFKVVRPKGYEAKHRDHGHLGATIKSQPLTEVMPAEGRLCTAEIHIGNVDELDRDAERIADQHREQRQAIDEDVRHEFAGWDKAFTAPLTCIDRVIAALDSDTPVQTYRTLVSADVTQAIDMAELRAEQERVGAL